MLSNIRLKNIAEWTSASVTEPFPRDTVVKDISSDSRTISDGSLFTAIKGERFDGHEYVPQVFAKGAVAALVEHRSADWPTTMPVLEVPHTVRAMAQIGAALRQKFRGPVFALTGSAGKSSTKNMIASLLGENTLASPKSFNNLQGVSQTLFLIEDTTKKIVLEMGMNARNEIAEMCEYFQPQYALITNIGTAHIGRLGGQEQIYLAKKELFDAIAHSGSSDKAVAVNVDDKLVVRAADEALPKTVRRLTYSSSGANAEVQILKKSLHPDTGALNVEISFAGKREEYEVPVFGLHQAENLAAAVAAALILGETADAIASRLPSVRSGEHRGEMFRSPRGVSVLDESYNSNPSALVASMKSTFEMDPKMRRVLVLGEMKELESFSEELHTNAAKSLVDIYRAKKTPFLLVGVGKHFAPFVDHIRKSLPEIPVHHTQDAQSAIQTLSLLLGDGDLVLVKGSRGIALEKVVTWLKSAD